MDDSWQPCIAAKRPGRREMSRDTAFAGVPPVLPVGHSRSSQGYAAAGEDSTRKDGFKALRRAFKLPTRRELSTPHARRLRSHSHEGEQGADKALVADFRFRWLVTTAVVAAHHEISSCSSWRVPLHTLHRSEHRAGQSCLFMPCRYEL